MISIFNARLPKLRLCRNIRWNYLQFFTHMKSNFFRNDLNLSGRWWHRLLLVIFFASCILALHTMYDYFDSLILPQYEIVNSVNDRITTEVKSIRELREPNEIVEERYDLPGASYHLNASTDKSLYDDIYCSSDLENKIIDVKNKSGISTLYIRDVYGRNIDGFKQPSYDVPIETYADYVKENNIDCVIADSYTMYDVNRRENGKLRFLEPIGPDSFFYKDLVFYKKSDFISTLYVLKISLLVIAGFVTTVVLYYKIVLYVIFGPKKNDNTEDSKKI